MMENPYQRLSPRGNVPPFPAGLYPGQPDNPTLHFKYSILRTSVSGKSHQLPLTDNCENSFWNAGQARVVMIMLHNQMGYQMI